MPNPRVLLIPMVALFLIAQGACAQSDQILQLYLPKAKQGDAAAEYTVGARYYQLHDTVNAKIWLQKAAAQGYPNAALFLHMIEGGSASPPGPSAMSGNPGMAGATGLCPGTGRAIEKDGILGPLQQATKQIPAGTNPRLSMVMLRTQGVCQYTFVLNSGKTMNFIDLPGGLRLGGSGVASGAAKVVLPDAFTDLPAAIAAAEKQGMQLPLKGAMLMMEQPRGKTPIAAWTLQPKLDPKGRVESYFVAAADNGRPLTLNDVSDVANDYNAQWQHIVDQFHAAAEAKQNAASASAGGCVHKGEEGGINEVVLWSGHWVYSGPTDANGRPLMPQMVTSYTRQQMSPYWTCARDN